MNQKITIDICTKGRYFSTLPLTIQSILNQTILPSEIFIYDDNNENEKIDLRSIPIYRYLFKLMEIKNIEWCVVYGKANGQVSGHQFIKEHAKNDWIFRVDDDEVLESNVLENLCGYTEDMSTLQIEQLHKDIFIIAPLVLIPSEKPKKLNQCKNEVVNRIEDYQKSNFQWDYNVYNSGFFRYAEHVYSCFLYNRNKCLDFYVNLSKVGHGEETIFSYRNYKHKRNPVIDVNSIVWHYRNPEGGIRNNDKELFESDAIKTKKVIDDLKDWNGERIIIISGGIGDHFAFRNSIDIEVLKKKYGEIWLALAHPDTFYDVDIKKISIEKAMNILSERVVDKYNVYRYMIKNNFDSNGKSIIDAYREIWL